MTSPNEKELPFAFRIFARSRFVFRTFFAVPIYALFSYFASPLFLVFPAACVLLIFAPSTHRTCLWTCFLRVFAFLFAIMMSRAWLQWLRGMLATCFLSSPMQCAAPTACPCLWQHVRCALKCVIGIADELPCCVPCNAGIA